MTNNDASANGKAVDPKKACQNDLLDAGQSVVIDAVHLGPEERRGVKRVASRSKANFIGLWLEAPLNTLMA